MTLAGLPHSEIPGSKRACRSPRHIAACHVFHRLSVPRHPPSTLSNLTIKCLDLMRSAVRRLAYALEGATSLLCISSLLSTRIQLSKKLRSRGPTLETIVIDCFHRLSLRDSLDHCCVGGGSGFGSRELVELIGIEPTTLCLQSRCSPS